MAADPVTSIAKAVSSVADLVAKYLSTREVRRMKAAIDAAERYIQVNEKMGDENRELNAEDRKKLLGKFRRRFFKFN